jgi:hypothetical protein
MTDEERAALKEQGFEPYADVFEVLSRDQDGEWRATAYRAVVVTARSAEAARRRVIDALGREPDDLRVLLSHV